MRNLKTPHAITCGSRRKALVALQGKTRTDRKAANMSMLGRQLSTHRTVVKEGLQGCPFLFWTRQCLPVQIHKQAQARALAVLGLQQEL